MRKKKDCPSVYVIAGPNGAGKTTFAAQFLPDFVDCREFLNADLIAAGLSPFSPESQNVRAGRLLLERLRELRSRRASFGFETTLSGRTYGKLLSDMRNEGYRVELFFLWLPDPEIAVKRVATRVRQGGHNVPPEDVRRRYVSGICNLFSLYRALLDGFWLYDASFAPPKLVAYQALGRLKVTHTALHRRIQQQVEAFLENDA